MSNSTSTICNTFLKIAFANNDYMSLQRLSNLIYLYEKSYVELFGTKPLLENAEKRIDGAFYYSLDSYYEKMRSSITKLRGVYIKNALGNYELGAFASGDMQESLVRAVYDSYRHVSDGDLARHVLSLNSWVGVDSEKVVES